MTTAHEPRRGPGTHLSVEDLSALAEGAQPSAVDAHEHLLECAACRGEVDAISELLAQFEDWDAPTIPREVAIRIDAALVRESAARAETLGAAAGSDSAEPGSAAPSRSATTSGSTGVGRSTRRHWLPARGLAWALASLVLIAGGFGLVLKLASTGGSSGAGASSASGTVNSAMRPEAGPNGQYSESRGAAQTPTLAAPNSRLAQWTRQVLAGERSLAEPFSTAASSCTSDPAYTAWQRLATTGGMYDGVASMLVVYANPSDTTKVLAVVYAVPCAASRYHVIDQALVMK